ncbi:hypothetical protein [Paenibacillus sp. FSL W8-0194]|uniref:hypothetical protein n=1 Tax=Paenibacillus sp. FSL W8-0194 TaxID=2921711 RepID=UPI0030D86CFF
MVHDHTILSYQVDFQKDIIAIHTVHEGKENLEEADIIFNGVFNHFFEHHLKDSIILDICESDLSSFIKENSELILRGQNYGWPTTFNSLDEVEKELVQEGYKYFILMSSYGMNGWVLAKSYEIITR